jgi:hypothetical protein
LTAHCTTCRFNKAESRLLCLGMSAAEGWTLAADSNDDDDAHIEQLWTIADLPAATPRHEGHAGSFIVRIVDNEHAHCIDVRTGALMELPHAFDYHDGRRPGHCWRYAYDPQSDCMRDFAYETGSGRL